KLSVDMVVVAPDDPLVLGMVDALNAVGIKTFGPNKMAAAIEGSKVFSKNLMEKFDIPTAKYQIFSNANDAISYVKSEKSYPTVIKADGLAFGKGVIIAETEKEAVDAITSIMEDKIFGESGKYLVVEEFLTGPEVSVLAFCDGETVIPMVSSMDHKRANDCDQGLNTGGMGAIAPNPYYTKEISNECMKKIFLPTVKAMKSVGRPFKGCLYFGLMLTRTGAKVIEYNCRFGDPEAQVILPLLDTDLVDIFDAVFDGTLDKMEIKWKRKSCACVIIASGGYPQKYETGIEINGLNEKGQLENAFVYHSGTKHQSDKFLTAGGRVLGVTATGLTLKLALSRAYLAVRKIKFTDEHYRKDIGKKALKDQKN
ncbi:MAG: phosphoribosylamine--glycine ligase, partial [Oscillospiraceae bacterium]